MVRVETTDKIPYSECKNKGFDEKLCSKQLISLYGKSNCICNNNKVGKLTSGFRKKCECN